MSIHTYYLNIGLDYRKTENSTTGDAIMQCHIKEEGELAANRGKFCIKCTYLGTFPSSMTLRHVVIRPFVSRRYVRYGLR